MRSTASLYGKLTTLLLSASAATIYAGLATAQTTEEPRAARPVQEQGGLQEVLVTAQRRSESVQNVPIAITALTADQLQTAGVTQLENLSQVTPGLYLSPGFGSNFVFMRGVGSINEFAGAEPSVALYVDGVYYADPDGGLQSISNVERIEVLKGPQGTLYGRNATGGLINVITPAPQADPLVKASVAYESFNAVVASLYATGGTEQLKVSLSADVRHQGDGYSSYVLFNNLPADFQEYQNYRGKILWEPTTADRITLSANYYRNPSDFGLINSVLPGHFSSTGGFSYAPNPRATTENPASNHFSENKDLALHWEHRFDTGPVLKSTSAVRHVDYHVRAETDGGPIPAFVSPQAKLSWSYQQEFLLQGTANVLLDRPLDYTTGVFFFDSKVNPMEFDFLADETQLIQNQTQRSDTKSYAAYGQVDYHLTDRDTLTAGARYTWDILKYNILSATPAGSTYIQPPTASFGEPTWRLALKHQLADQWMVYGSYSRGYKAGLYDNEGVAADNTINLVKPELLNAFEVGTKGTFLNGNLQLGLNGFLYHYTNIQVESFIGANVLLQNAATAEIYGVEPEVTAAIPVPVGDLQLRATGTILSNEYKQFHGCTLDIPLSNPPGGNANPAGECSGKHLVFAPEQQYTVGINYTAPVPIGGKVGVAATLSHTGTTFFVADNSVKQTPYNLVSAEFSYLFADGRTRVRAYGTNLTNALAINYAAAFFSETEGVYIPPRIFGVGIEYRSR